MLLALLLLQNPADFPRVRDSAGIHIVENQSRANAAIAFRVGKSALIDLYGHPANTSFQFLNQSGAPRSIRLSDGRLVVSDHHRLIFYSANGSPERSVGQKGKKPGEFISISSICRTRGDTIVVAEASSPRMTVLDRSGALVHTFDAPGAKPIWDRCFDDGTLLLSYPASGLVEGPGGDEPMVLERRDLFGKAVRRGGIPYRIPYMSYNTGETNVIVRSSQIYIADRTRSEVRILRESGELIGLVRTADVNRSAAVKSAREARMHSGFNPEFVFDYWASYRSMLVDEGGRIWLENIPPKRSVSTSWSCFDANGILLGSFGPPIIPELNRLKVLSFSGNSVLVRGNDAKGDIHLRSYPLVPAKH